MQTTNAPAAPSAAIRGQLFDGRSAAAQAVYLYVEAGYACLRLEQADSAAEPLLRCPLRQVDFGETTVQGQRLVVFPEDEPYHGAQFVPLDAAATQSLAALLAATGLERDWVARITQRWRWVIGCALAVVATMAGLYLYGIPAAAKVAAPHVPEKITALLGASSLATLEKYVLKPSELPELQQAALRARWQVVLAKAYPDAKHPPPPNRLLFRNWSKVPNAFALPDGTMVLTDEIVHLLADKPDALMGVLAHELGHLSEHHSMRNLIQFTLLAYIRSAFLGDYSSWLTDAPLLLGQMAYSREHEAQADDAAIRTMQAAGINPAELAVFFERVMQYSSTKPKDTDSALAKVARKIDIPDVLASHPNSSERMDKLRAAGKGK